MDRALDEIIADRPRRGGGGASGRGGRRPNRASNFPRDGIKKREEPRSLDSEWLHDKYTDDDVAISRRRGRPDRYTSDQGRNPPNQGAKLKFENLHYEVTEEELRELCAGIGEVQSVRLIYDRQDRSEGIAYVTYFDVRDARLALHEFDGANAYRQPIRVTMVPSAPTGPSRNPFDTAEPPNRSLADRISMPDSRRRRGRSASPIRRSDVSRPAPEGIDRYVPGQRSGGRSPIRRRGTPRDGGRRPGTRREPRPRRAEEGHQLVQGRPRKTQEELDAEMDNYWEADDGGQSGAQNQNSFATTAEFGDASSGDPAAMGTIMPGGDDDIDMIE
ncbi:MAG: hypothetical protein Q9157_008589 [Trypethelium eluteriae]